MNIIKKKFKVIAKDLKFPEGPIFMNDGSIILVEIARGTLSKVNINGSVEVVADLGGGPNGAAIGPDGHCYVCNNGGFEWEVSLGKKGMRPISQSKNYIGGSIQKVNLSTGQYSTLYTECNGVALKGPNDIVFDKNGNFWFTDLGKVRKRNMDRGAIYWAKSDGSEIKEVIQPFMTPNGIGLSPDEQTLYVAETEGGKLYSYKIINEGQVEKITFPESINGGKLLNIEGGIKRFDSLALEENGNICVATLINGGISVISPEGNLVEFVKFDDPYITNICFGSQNLKTAYITASFEGLLLEVDWNRQGLPLNFLNI
ncbi:SMP-30/gluconolactonase/LRE family protein [Alphaproteobacteria bacterium]|jgi:gluconolactonase|nr:SMP-30/gluconolactonase/LRE family protein [Alphaproteobacteria bacterium]|tara:strand:- start:638 stop:1582 length:945 start_codon:yes stop_codon:yes gene_type:complete